MTKPRRRASCAPPTSSPLAISTSNIVAAARGSTSPWSITACPTYLSMSCSPPARRPGTARRCRSGSESATRRSGAEEAAAEQQQHLHVHRRALGALAFDQRRHSRERDAVDDDVLALQPAAL